MIVQFLALLWVHWIADFVLQTHWQASNKSKNMEALARHVGTYTVVLAFATPMIFIGAPLGRMWLFVMLNAVLHLATDFVTSRISSKLFMAEFEIDPMATGLMMKKDFNPHYFFVVIGFDQLIHQATLAWTMMALL